MAYTNSNPLISATQFSILRNSRIFLKRTDHITSHHKLKIIIIKCYVFNNILTILCLKCLPLVDTQAAPYARLRAEVFCSVINEFLPNTASTPTRCAAVHLLSWNFFWQLVVRLRHCPKCDNSLDSGRVNWYSGFAFSGAYPKLKYRQKF